MENLIANLSGRTRKETIGSREYIVAPLTMIVPGVLNGSQGPLLYSPEEIARNYSAWNGMPLVANHPSEGGSARKSIVLHAQGIGLVLNATIQKEELKAEAWFDVESTNIVDSRILAAISTGKKIEVSTGLGIDTRDAPQDSVFNGQSYIGIATNFKPDHLAILFDDEGACSLGDGCGVNNKTDKGESPMNPEEKKAIVDDVIANSCCHDEEDRETLNALTDERLTKMQKKLQSEAEQTLVANKASESFIDTGGNKHVYNQKTGKWETTAKVENEKPKEKVVEKKPTENAKPLTEEEWLAAAPVSVQEDLTFARNEKAKQKQSLVQKIVANVKDTTQKVAMAEKFAGYSLEVLQDMAAVIPEAPKQRVLNYAGAAEPAEQPVKNVVAFAAFGLPQEYIPSAG